MTTQAYLRHGVLGRVTVIAIVERGAVVSGFEVKYWPELDGLRALAVVLVMLAHAGVPGFRMGGVMGVGTFFVLSGFLITALLLREVDRSGGIALRAFWRRRVVRLIPALVLVVAAVWVSGVGPSVWETVGVLGYAANWLRVAGRPLSPLNHTWSLSIEEQFYVVWPLAMLGLLRWRRDLFEWIVILGVGSVLLRAMIWGRPGYQVNRVYFGTDTNAFLLLAGCGLAVLLVGGRVGRCPRWLGWVSVAGLLVLSGWEPSQWWAFVGGPTVGALAAVVAVWWMATNSVSGWRSRPVVEVGRMSYSLYLWHVPVFAWWHSRVGPFTPVGVVAAFSVSFGCAAGSYYLVERPLLRFKSPACASDHADVAASAG